MSDFKSMYSCDWKCSEPVFTMCFSDCERKKGKHARCREYFSGYRDRWRSSWGLKARA